MRKPISIAVRVEPMQAALARTESFEARLRKIAQPLQQLDAARARTAAEDHAQPLPAMFGARGGGCVRRRRESVDRQALRDAWGVTCAAGK